MTAVTHCPERIDEVAEWLRDGAAAGRRVRLVGGGSRQHERAPIADGVARLDLSRLDRIVRLDPGDQTCTVECGLSRAHLDEALAEHELELPCLGDGTIGGLFAADPFGPAGAPPAQSPRSLLLGLDAALADGQPFKSGARVVKSVAGFDLHKLFVGSHGRLFVALRLHLRLKPRPRAMRWFCNEGLDATAALALLDALRAAAVPPDVLALRRERGGSCTLFGRAAGRPTVVEPLLREHDLQIVDQPIDCTPPLPSGDAELLAGAAAPSQLPQVLALLPDAASLTWFGGGRFHLSLDDPASSDRALTALEACGAAATVRAASRPDRLQRGTPRDRAAERIAEGLRQALDPDGLLS